MSRDLLFFGDSRERLAKALASLKRGGGVIVLDDDDRENEGDLIFPAQTLTEGQMALMIRHCSGIVCLCLTPEKAGSLELAPMTAQNTSQYGTAFTVSIEAARGVGTGVSAKDRVRTVKTAVADSAKPEDLNRPGHVFPLVARKGGVLERPGHTEATVDLMKLAGLTPAGVLCELTNDDGTMSRLPEISIFAKEMNFPVLTVEDIIDYRNQTEGPVDFFNLTSPCGLDCFNCRLFLAQGDAELRRSLAAELEVPEEKAVCRGCRNQKGRVPAIGRLTSCYIYACAQERQLDFCGGCPDFPCDYLHPLADQADRRPHNTKLFNSCLIKKMGLDSWAAEKARQVKEKYFEGKLRLND